MLEQGEGKDNGYGSSTDNDGTNKRPKRRAARSTLNRIRDSKKRSGGVAEADTSASGLMLIPHSAQSILTILYVSFFRMCRQSSR